MFSSRFPKDPEDCLIALDFDGVVWDGVRECFVISRIALENLYGDAAFLCDLEDGFRKGRFLCRTGEDFFLILQLLRRNSAFDFTSLSRRDFAALKAGFAKEMETFAGEFYQQRLRMRRDNPDLWTSLQGPYPSALKDLERLRERFRQVVITSTKDSESVKFLLERSGIALPVYGREFSKDKRKQISAIAAKYRAPTEAIIFVDDLLENLLPVREMGVRVAMASWGYNTPREREEAFLLGIPLLGPGRVVEDLLGAFFGVPDTG